MDNLIISKAQISKKTKRMAYQILEDYFDEKELYLIAIDGPGIDYGKLLKKELLNASNLMVKTGTIKLNKRNPCGNNIELSISTDELKNKHVILIDDVANSGKTLFYSFKPFVDVELKSLRVAVLVERKYKQFPIYPDYVGTKLNTTIKEHINVAINNETIEGVYLE